MSVWRRARGRSARDYMLFAEATVALGIAALLVSLAPFSRIAAIAARPIARTAGADVDVARLRWAIRASARRVPWRAKCFEQGLAAQAMLRRRGIATVLHYGVAQSPTTGLIAHVWITRHGLDVIGGDNMHDFAEIARFPATATAASAGK